MWNFNCLTVWIGYRYSDGITCFCSCWDSYIRLNTIFKLFRIDIVVTVTICNSYDWCAIFSVFVSVAITCFTVVINIAWDARIDCDFFRFAGCTCITCWISHFSCNGVITICWHVVFRNRNIY